MAKNLNLIRVLFLLAGLPFIYFVITNREPNWLYHTSLGVILAGMVFNMVVDWRSGKRMIVYRRLGVYALIFLAALAITVF